MIHLCFELSMPNRGSWNGKWSGENNYYAIIRSFYNSDRNRVEKILAKTNYIYRWDDGWTAQISVTEVTANEVVKIKKRSKGFCGYKWMVDSICASGEILTLNEKKETQG